MRGRKRRRLRSAEPEFHHNVYVVLLSKLRLKDRSILRHNPERDPSKPAVYVGLTGLPVDHRFENHKNGYKSARMVRKYGVRLLPEMDQHLNPMPYETCRSNGKGPGRRPACPRLRRRGRYLGFGEEQKGAVLTFATTNSKQRSRVIRHGESVSPRRPDRLAVLSYQRTKGVSPGFRLREIRVLMRVRRRAATEKA